jgi:hypothetical protein
MGESGSTVTFSWQHFGGAAAGGVLAGLSWSADAVGDPTKDVSDATASPKARGNETAAAAMTRQRRVMTRTGGTDTWLTPRSRFDTDRAGGTCEIARTIPVAEERAAGRIVRSRARRRHATRRIDSTTRHDAPFGSGGPQTFPAVTGVVIVERATLGELGRLAALAIRTVHATRGATR